MSDYRIVEIEREAVGRRVLREKPPYHIGFVYFEYRGGGYVIARGRVHIAQAGDGKPAVGLEFRRFDVEYLVGDFFCDDERSACSRVVYAARFEVYAFDAPAHGPVDFPHEFYEMIVAEIDRFGLTADFTSVSYIFGFFVIRQYFGKIFYAVAAINAQRIVIFSFALVAVLRFVLH